MPPEKKSPKETTADRQARDKLEYERLVKEIEDALEHRSPGLFGWLDDVLDTVADAAGSAWQTANELVDTYVWDTSEDEAAVEAWVKEMFDSPYNAVSDFVQDAADNISDVYNDLAAEVGNTAASVEDWIRDTFDIVDVDGQGIVAEAVDKAGKIVDDYVNQADTFIHQAGGSVEDAVNDLVDDTVGVIDTASAVLGIGFDFAMAALGGLPGLFTSWVNELRGFFEFDMDDFIDTIKKLSGSDNLPPK